jgi:hypothetical protein
MTASAAPVLKRVYAEVSDRIDFATLYVREAHPGDQLPQPATWDQKLAHARALQERDALPWVVGVDDLDGSLHRQLDPKPNAAYVINPDGRVAVRLLWSNHARSLRETLNQIASDPHTIIGQREPHLLPLLSGLGKTEEVLSRAGQTARRDFRRAAPPIYALARLAAVFGPLPPAGRALAAIGVAVAGALALIAGAVSLGR